MQEEKIPHPSKGNELEKGLTPSYPPRTPGDGETHGYIPSSPPSNPIPPPPPPMKDE